MHGLLLSHYVQLPISNLNALTIYRIRAVRFKVPGLQRGRQVVDQKGFVSTTAGFHQRHSNSILHSFNENERPSESTNILPSIQSQQKLQCLCASLYILAPALEVAVLANCMKHLIIWQGDLTTSIIDPAALGIGRIGEFCKAPELLSELILPIVSEIDKLCAFYSGRAWNHPRVLPLKLSA
jgi:hypothetical protein